jgi:uncharacterized protein (UPF0335 family)
MNSAEHRAELKLGPTPCKSRRGRLRASRDPGRRAGETQLDDRLKHLMKELGDAINESLSESEQIGDVIAKIKAHGYDVFLVLEATIGFSKRDAEGDNEEATAEPVAASARRNESDAQFKINASDLKFLKSLRISVE